MQFGGAMFFTDYSMSAMELARALEERGFESVWAPEHSHIPMSRKTPFPGGGDLAQTILRCHGPVRGACRVQPGYQDYQARQASRLRGRLPCRPSSPSPGGRARCCIPRASRSPPSRTSAARQQRDVMAGGAIDLDQGISGAIASGAGIRGLEKAG